MNFSQRPLIVFDMDGTLIDSLPDLGNSSRHLLQTYHLPIVNDQTVRSMIGDGIKVLVERLLTHTGDKANNINREKAIECFLSHYMQHSTQYSRLFNGALECLEECKKRQWLIALCTNKITTAAKDILHEFNITNYFDAIGGGDSFADKKPHACHLEGIMQLVNANPEKTVMIGDHHNDILVARNAQIAGSIFAKWGYGNNDIGLEATLQANSMTDIPKLVQQIIL